MKCFDEQGAPTDLMNEGVLFFKQRNFRLFSSLGAKLKLQ